jgi:hypothetical protein
MFDYSTSFTCSIFSTWAAGLSCKTFINGAHELAYYGTFGMPNVIVLGGTSHTVFLKTVGFNPPTDGPLVRNAVDQALIATGIDEQYKEDDLVIFPNPTNNYSYLSFNKNSTSEISISVSDLLRNNIYNENIGFYNLGQNVIKLETNNFPSGIYLVEIISGSSRLNKKLIVSK